jgi:N-acetylmuramoyl-L-alanine amidase
MDMEFQQKYEITKRYLPVPSKRRSGLKMEKVLFIVAHDTGNVNSTAEQNVRYFERSANDMSASAHLFVDDKHIIECIPALTASPEKAWHVRYNTREDNRLFGVDANDAAIGVELCYSTNGTIRNEEAYKRYVWTIAYICHKFGLDPKTKIVGHEKLDSGRKTDPSNALRYMNKTYKQLLQDIVTEYETCRRQPEAKPPSNESKKQPSKIGTMTVKANLLNIRSTPSMNGKIIGTLKKGDQRAVYTQQNGWYAIGSGQWVSGNPNYVMFIK